MKKKLLMLLPISLLILSSCGILPGYNIASGTNTNTTPTNTTTSPITQSSTTPSTNSSTTNASTTVVEDDSYLYYDDLFNLNNKVELSVNVSDSELKKINDDYMCNTYRMANSLSIKITYPNGNVITKEIDEVGIRMKGNTSRTSFLNGRTIENNVHFKLSFDETFDDEVEYKANERKVWTDSNARKIRKDRTFFGLSKLELKFNREIDMSFSRDIYASNVYRENGVYAQKTGLCLLSFDNQNVSSGYSSLYKIYEPVDSTFIKRYFPKGLNDGDLYKATYGNETGMPTLNQTDPNAYGVDKEIYKNQKKLTYDLKTNKKKSNQEKIRKFLGWINNSKPDISEALGSFMDEDYFYTFMAIQYLTGDWDNFLYDSNNYYLYFDDNGKAYFIPYDMDRCFGIQAKNHGMVDLSYNSDWNLQGDNNRSNLLIKTIFKDGSTAQAKYIAKIQELAPKILDNNVFETTVYNNVYNTYSSFETINTGNYPSEANNAPKSYFDNKLETIKKSLV